MGETTWIEIGDCRAQEKVKQAMREIRSKSIKKEAKIKTTAQNKTICETRAAAVELPPSSSSSPQHSSSSRRDKCSSPNASQSIVRSSNDAAIIEMRRKLFLSLRWEPS